jgi:hypothetical protein
MKRFRPACGYAGKARMSSLPGKALRKMDTEYTRLKGWSYLTDDKARHCNAGPAVSLASVFVAETLTIQS